MSRGQAIVPGDLFRRNTGFGELTIQQFATAGAGLPIHNADILAGQVGDAANLLGIAGRDHQTLLPEGERYHGDAAFGEHPPHRRKVEIAR